MMSHLQWTDITAMLAEKHRKPKEYIAYCMSLGYTRKQAKHSYNERRDTTVFQCDEYVVHVTKNDGGFVKLGIRNLDGSSKRDWRDFQQIKNDLVGEEREAVELYPAESRLMDECNQFWLWCLPPGALFPIGVFQKRNVQHKPDAPGSYQRDLKGEELYNNKGEVEPAELGKAERMGSRVKADREGEATE